MVKSVSDAPFHHWKPRTNLNFSGVDILRSVVAAYYPGSDTDLEERKQRKEVEILVQEFGDDKSLAIRLGSTIEHGLRNISEVALDE